MMSHPLVYCWYFSMDYDRVHQVMLVVAVGHQDNKVAVTQRDVLCALCAIVCVCMGEGGRELLYDIVFWSVLL